MEIWRGRGKGGGERKKERIRKTACRQLEHVNILGSSFEDKAMPWGLW